MRKLLMALCATVLVSAACGGGGDRDSGYRLRAAYPDRLLPYAEKLNARATIVGPDAALFSAPADGRMEEGVWHFSPEAFTSELPRGSLLRIEFWRPASGLPEKAAGGASREIVLAILSIPVETFAGDVPEPSGEQFDFAPDADGDGLPNIDELSFGVDPFVADSDGDGRRDGDDAFPSIAAEWSDTDGDGIGDNADDDIDGDGWSNAEERLFGTDPARADSDGDGRSDPDDVCPLVPDSRQLDADGDGRGDACDDDVDGDGLADAQEIARGTDRLRADTDGDGAGDGLEVRQGSDPLRPDTDGDGVHDGADNCPTAANAPQDDRDGDRIGDACDDDRDGDGIFNAADRCPDAADPGQEDTDGDGMGDACDPDADGDVRFNAQDNCPFVANPNQLAIDADADGVPAECDLDDADAGVGDADSGVFVDGAHGSDAGLGTRAKPMATIAAALARAVPLGLPVYVAAGSSDAATLALPAGARIFGGFRNGAVPGERFSSRDVRSAAGDYRTILTRSDVPTTLAVAADAIVDGFHIYNDAAAGGSFVSTPAVVELSGGAPQLLRCTIEGNASASAGVGVRVKGGTPRLLESTISGGGRDSMGSTSAALIVEGGAPLIANDILIAGSGRFATGVRLAGGAPRIVNATVDAGSGNGAQGIAEGIVVEAGAPLVVNSIIATRTAPDQYAVVCAGAPDAGASFRFNLLSGLAPDGTGPLVLGCDGALGRSAAFSLGAAAVESNIYRAAPLADIVDGAWRPTSPDAIDRGIDASVDEFGAIRNDFFGTARPRGGAYDLGAVER